MNWQARVVRYVDHWSVTLKKLKNWFWPKTTHGSQKLTKTYYPKPSVHWGKLLVVWECSKDPELMVNMRGCLILKIFKIKNFQKQRMNQYKLIYLWHLSMKEGRLFVLFWFCGYEIHRSMMLQIVLLVSLESSWWGGVCMGLVPCCLDLWCKSSWILNDFFSENEIQSQLKISKELECAFGVVGKISMSMI
jgi:hypothetical protein